MFDLLEEYVSTQEQEADKNTEEKGARTFDPHSAALFSMPEKFIQKEDAEKKKGHPLVSMLLIFIVVLVVAAVGFAFAIQNKNLRETQEKIAQEAARFAALKADENQNKIEGQSSEENIPFQITEPTSTESTTSSLSTSTESVSSSLSFASSTFSDASFTSTSSTASTASSTNTGQEAITFGEDSDKDKLSDVEERIYKTDVKKPDTDLDGVLDGAEIKNSYDPTKGQGAVLKDSGLVDVFTNQTYHYSFFYPKMPDEWAVGALDQSQKEVMVSAATGEYISVRVEENSQKLSILDWYTAVYATGKSSESVRNASFGEWNALMREDGNVYYLTRKDEHGGTLTPYVYVLTYASNTKKELNYFTTFQMFVKSFSSLEIVVTIEQ